MTPRVSARFGLTAEDSYGDDNAGCGIQEHAKPAVRYSSSMKGVVFNLLESFICEGWGDAVYETILEGCPLHTREPFVGPGTYPDADLVSIASATARHLGLTLPDALRAFGAFCLPHLVGSVPDLVAPMKTPEALLHAVDGVIHVEVRKLFPKAHPPRFVVEDQPDGTLRLEYRSDRKLCAFLEGIFDGLGDHFGCDIRADKQACMHQGADHCAYQLSISARVQAVTSRQTTMEAALPA